MRYFQTILAALTCLACAAQPACAANTLTGQMAGRNFLLGSSWNCITNVPSIMGMPARTDAMTVSFDVVPHNVLHVTLSGADYRGDEYFGYSERFKNFWNTSASSHGIHTFATSADGMTFSGTSYLGTGSMHDSITYTKLSDTKTTVREVLSGNGNSFTIKSHCTR